GMTVAAAIDVTASGTDSSAGTIDLGATGNVDVLAPLRAFDITSNGAFGGVIKVNGGGNVSIQAAVDARATGERSSRATIDLIDGGNLTINASVDGHANGTDSEGAAITLTASAGDLSINNTVDASATGTDAFGGTLDMLARGLISTAMSIAVDGSGDGGDI